MTKTLGQSALVACLFAIHPLHVESVAWIAERKDVLSTFFWMLTMGAYAIMLNIMALGYIFLSLLFFALSDGKTHAGYSSFCIVASGLLAPAAFSGNKPDHKIQAEACKLTPSNNKLKNLKRSIL